MAVIQHGHIQGQPTVLTIPMYGTMDPSGQREGKLNCEPWKQGARESICDDQVVPAGT